MEEIEAKLTGDSQGLVVITGGVRSGKSLFAESMAERSNKKIIYLATARVEDDEMRERVARHRQRRSTGVFTYEEPYEPHLVLEKESNSSSLILVDCLTLLISNRILRDLENRGAVSEGEDIYAEKEIIDAATERTLDYIRTFTKAARNCLSDVLVVTNEVGMGVVPNYPVARAFRDLSGQSNQVLAASADQVWMVVCGIPQRLK